MERGEGEGGKGEGAGERDKEKERERGEERSVHNAKLYSLIVGGYLTSCGLRLIAKNTKPPPLECLVVAF